MKTTNRPTDALPPPATTLRAELRALFWLALPIVAVNLGNTLTGLVDTAVVGRLGEVQLGAVGLGNSVFFVISVLGMGIMLGLDPLISQALGAGQGARARALFGQGIWLAAVVCVPLSLVVLAITARLDLLGIDPENAWHAARYVYWRLPSLLPLLVIGASRTILQALGTTRPMLVSVAVMNLVNVPVTWFLVFGDEALTRFGFGPIGLGEGMGTAGAGLASTLATLVQLGVLLLAVRVQSRQSGASEQPGGRTWPQPTVMGRVLRIGLPIGAMLGLEVGIFAVTSVFMGNLGKLELAAHQVAIMLASTAFMVPMGIGAAAAVRVGRAIGAGDTPATRLAGVAAMVAGGASMLVTAVLFVAAPRTLAALLTTEASTTSASVALLTVAAVFQLSDGLQAIGAGALRGAGDTLFPLIANLVGHWVIGLPIALVLGFTLGLGAEGLWWGLCAGLTAVALSLTLRFLNITSRPIERLDDGSRPSHSESRPTVAAE